MHNNSYIHAHTIIAGAILIENASNRYEMKVYYRPLSEIWYLFKHYMNPWFQMTYQALFPTEIAIQY